MSFILRMAAREVRASWRRLLFFFVSVAIGVGVIVALRSVVQHARHALARDARALLAADVTISTSRPWSDSARATIARRLADAPVLARTEKVELATMARPVDAARAIVKMVELSAVQPLFPLYGRVTLASGEPYSHALVRGRGALVGPELLAGLGLAVGDGIVIGRQVLTIRGVIATEPGRRLGPFSLGPRVLMDHADLAETGLLAFGSRARYQIALRIEERGVNSLVRRLRSDVSDQFIAIRSYRTAEDQIGEDLARAENYLSLVGLAIVFLGGIGVSSVTRVFVQQKVKSIAVLKCLGGTNRQILAIYLAQACLLGLAGSLLGLALARASMVAIPRVLASGSPGFLELSDGLTAGAVAQGLSIGLLVSLLFSLVPLLDLRHVKPSALLRRDQAPRRRDPVKLAAIAGVGAGLVALASWQVASWRVGLTVCAGLAMTGLALHLAGLALVRALRPLAHTRRFAVRHAVLHLSRPGSQTRAIVLAVGLGSFFIVGVRALQANLLREFALETRPDAPDLFVIDIQPDQAASVRGLLSGLDAGVGARPRLIPVLRARITGVRGREINLDGFEDVRGRGSLGREYVITYRSHLEANEQLVEGQFWTAPAPGSSGAEAAVSIEASIRDRFDIHVGDTIRFDVLSRIVRARVTSVRQVDWKDTRSGGFMFVFRPGVFEGAPHTFIAPVRGPRDAAARARIQHELVSQFPNLSVIDAREVLNTARGVVANVTLAITVVGALVLLSGGLILAGSVAVTRFQRIYEAAIVRTLGATTRTIATMLVVEYGIVGGMAGAIGSVGAMALTWGVSRYALDIPWHPAPGLTLMGILVTTLGVVTIGVAASGDVLRRKPLATLRAE